jgi:hypothetical protein
MHGPRSKIPSKKSRQAALPGGFNFGVKGLIDVGTDQSTVTLLKINRSF